MMTYVWLLYNDGVLSFKVNRNTGEHSEQMGRLVHRTHEEENVI